MDGWMDACMHQRVDKLNTCVNGLVDAWIDVFVDTRMDALMGAVCTQTKQCHIGQNANNNYGLVTVIITWAKNLTKRRKFSTTSNTWTKPTTTGIIPSAREGVNSIVYGSFMVLFGGRTAPTSYSDELYTLNLRTYKFTKLSISGTGPSRRGWYRAAPLLREWKGGGDDSLHCAVCRHPQTPMLVPKGRS